MSEISPNAVEPTAVEPNAAEPNAAQSGAVQPASAADSLPRSVLIAAGLASLDGVMSVVLLALWSFSPDTALTTIRSMSGLALLLGIAPILVGGWILDRSRKVEGGIRGASWARWAILAGGLLTTVSILIPLTAALARITGSPET